jgi:hypothetical protein
MSVLPLWPNGIESVATAQRVSCIGNYHNPEFDSMDTAVFFRVQPAHTVFYHNAVPDPCALAGMQIAEEI